MWSINDSFGAYENLEIHGVTVGLFYQNSAALTVTSATGTGVTFNNYGTGAITSNAGVLSVTSDRRAKNPHGDYTVGLEAILHLNPVLYDFKIDEKHTERAGFYTQDVEPWIKQAVFHDSPDGMASLDDRPILGAAVNSIKTLAYLMAVTLVFSVLSLSLATAAYFKKRT
jgi:hypothetical protein